MNNNNNNINRLNRIFDEARRGQVNGAFLDFSGINDEDDLLLPGFINNYLKSLILLNDKLNNFLELINNVDFINSYLNGAKLNKNRGIILKFADFLNWNFNRESSIAMFSKLCNEKNSKGELYYYSLFKVCDDMLQNVDGTNNLFEEGKKCNIIDIIDEIIDNALEGYLNFLNERLSNVDQHIDNFLKDDIITLLQSRSIFSYNYWNKVYFDKMYEIILDLFEKKLEVFDYIDQITFLAAAVNFGWFGKIENEKEIVLITKALYRTLNGDLDNINLISNYKLKKNVLTLITYLNNYFVKNSIHDILNLFKTIEDKKYEEFLINIRKKELPFGQDVNRIPHNKNIDSLENYIGQIYSNIFLFDIDNNEFLEKIRNFDAIKGGNGSKKEKAKDEVCDFILNKYYSHFMTNFNVFTGNFISVNDGESLNAKLLKNTGFDTSELAEKMIEKEFSIRIAFGEAASEGVIDNDDMLLTKLFKIQFAKKGNIIPQEACNIELFENIKNDPLTFGAEDLIDFLKNTLNIEQKVSFVYNVMQNQYFMAEYGLDQISFKDLLNYATESDVGDKIVAEFEREFERNKDIVDLFKMKFTRNADRENTIGKILQDQYKIDEKYNEGEFVKFLIKLENNVLSYNELLEEEEELEESSDSDESLESAESLEDKIKKQEDMVFEVLCRGKECRKNLRITFLISKIFAKDKRISFEKCKLFASVLNKIDEAQFSESDKIYRLGHNDRITNEDCLDILENLRNTLIEGLENDLIKPTEVLQIFAILKNSSFILEDEFMDNIGHLLIEKFNVYNVRNEYISKSVYDGFKNVIALDSMNTYTEGLKVSFIKCFKRYLEGGFLNNRIGSVFNNMESIYNIVEDFLQSFHGNINNEIRLEKDLVIAFFDSFGIFADGVSRGIINDENLNSVDIVNYAKILKIANNTLKNIDGFNFTNLEKRSIKNNCRLIEEALSDKYSEIIENKRTFSGDIKFGNLNRIGIVVDELSTEELTDLLLGKALLANEVINKIVATKKEVLYNNAECFEDFRKLFNIEKTLVNIFEEFRMPVENISRNTREAKEFLHELFLRCSKNNDKFNWQDFSEDLVSYLEFETKSADKFITNEDDADAIERVFSVKKNVNKEKNLNFLQWLSAYFGQRDLDGFNINEDEERRYIKEYVKYEEKNYLQFTEKDLENYERIINSLEKIFKEDELKSGEVGTVEEIELNFSTFFLSALIKELSPTGKIHTLSMVINMALPIFSNTSSENRLILITLSEALKDDQVDMTDDNLMEEAKGLITYVNDFIEKNSFDELWCIEDEEEEIEHYRERWESLNEILRRYNFIVDGREEAEEREEGENNHGNGRNQDEDGSNISFIKFTRHNESTESSSYISL